jgi:hypothetical protein
VAADHAHSADPRLAHGIQLIDEHDARRLALRLLEQIPDPGGAHADEHLDELGAGHGEERHVGFPGDRPGQQRLARARWSHEQHALGNPPSEPLILPRVPEEVDDLDQLGLRLVDAGHVLEGGLQLLAVVDLGLRAAEGQGLGRPATHAAHDQHPDAHHDRQRDDPAEQQIPPQGALDATGELDLVRLQLADQRRVVQPRDPGGREPADVPVRAQERPEPVSPDGGGLGKRPRPGPAGDLALGDLDALDLARADQFQELRHGDLDGPRREQEVLEHDQDDDRHQDVNQRKLKALAGGGLHGRHRSSCYARRFRAVKPGASRLRLTGSGLLLTTSVNLGTSPRSQQAPGLAPRDA